MKKYICMIICLMTCALVLTGCFSGETTESADSGEGICSALVPKPIAPNAVTRNPYMADSENSVHNDSYSSDVTNAVLPLGIHSQLGLSLETQNPQAPSAAFYDESGNAITPFAGGVAMADMSGDTITRKGVFMPSQHDGQNYRVQISYSFVDSHDNIVLPTTHGHIIVLKTRNGEGEILPVFEKIADVDVSSHALQTLGDDIDTNLLSIVYDYDGNLWFVTGGFRIEPDKNPAGFLGYVSRDYMESAMRGEHLNASEHIHLHRLSEGEGAENGISAGEQGTVILTNKACYLLNARTSDNDAGSENSSDNGINILWRTEYDSNGTNDAEPDSAYTGGGLAYGSGTTPTLTKELALFTDNMDPVNLLALSMETGEVVASIPVLDQLDENVPVSVENSILVYSGDNRRTSILVCNWFGAGNAGLSDPDADSSVQSYDNLYDANWLQEGNKYIAPGVERVDVVKEGDSYAAEKVWFRNDIRDTSMIKLSTATGYLYGYWQNMDTGMWSYEVLDFETGETAYALPVSSQPAYNNVAVGMIPDVKGNTLYCPTNNMEMVFWQDSFAYLPDTPAKEIDPGDMERYYMTDADFQEIGGSNARPATYLMRASVNNLRETTIAFQVNGLDGKVSDYALFYEDAKGALYELEGEWSIRNASGDVLEKDTSLDPAELVEIWVYVKDGDDMDLNRTEKALKASVILAVKP